MNYIDRLKYLCLKVVIYPLSLLPLCALYLLGDIFSWVAYYVVRYRVNVVQSNLRNSFPDKSISELKSIEKKFYSFLGEYVAETIKLLTICETEMRRRLIVENPDSISKALSGNKNVTLLLGHYCNWEWVSSLPLYFPENAECFQIYHPLHDKAFDKLFIKIRTRFKANNVPMRDILRKLAECKRDSIPTVTGYIADQSPDYNLHLFLKFLNQDTGVLTGPERISKFLNAEVWYCHMFRIKRGVYRLRFIPITLNPRNSDIFLITQEYFKMLEQNIYDAPQYWLWSHKRWKITRVDFMQVWGDKHKEQLNHL